MINIVVKPKALTTVSLDQALINKCLVEVEKSMENSDYSVDKLASALAMSRRQLSRKLQAVVGQSPSGFIRSIRLKRAAQLLSDSDYNISEIADISGFGTIRNFNQNFREKYGVTPTQYRAEYSKTQIIKVPDYPSLSFIPNLTFGQKCLA